MAPIRRQTNPAAVSSLYADAALPTRPNPRGTRCRYAPKTEKKDQDVVAQGHRPHPAAQAQGKRAPAICISTCLHTCHTHCFHTCLYTCRCTCLHTCLFTRIYILPYTCLLLTATKTDDQDVVAQGHNPHPAAASPADAARARHRIAPSFFILYFGTRRRMAEGGEGQIF